jgi:hypothetical protein
MNVNQNIKQKSIRRTVVIALAAITLSTAAVTGAPAAERGGESVTGGAGEGEIRGGGVPFQESAPQLPPPIFNPSSPYTVPAPGEIPVSPASPGSVFGND